MWTDETSSENAAPTSPLDMRSTARSSAVKVESLSDLLAVRLLVGRYAADSGLSEIENTKLTTAVSEIARDMLVHAGGGTMTIDSVMSGFRCGIRVVCRDRGPGSGELEAGTNRRGDAGATPGMGLAGVKRLVDEFALQTDSNQRMVVCVVKWKGPAR